MSVPRKHVAQPYYSFLTVIDPVLGRPVKIEEGRVIGEFWNNSLIGKEIEFFLDEEHRTRFVVVGVTNYVADRNLQGKDGIALRDAIRKMLLSKGVSNMLPDLRPDQVEEGVAKYMSWNQDKLMARVIGAFEVRMV